MFTTFFWFFQSPTTVTPAWILTLKTSNDAVLRKEVPFEGYESEISYLTESHARTVARECCKGDDESQWERGKFDPPPPKKTLNR